MSKCLSVEKVEKSFTTNDDLDDNLVHKKKDEFYIDNEYEGASNDDDTNELKINYKKNENGINFYDGYFEYDDQEEDFDSDDRDFYYDKKYNPKTSYKKKRKKDNNDIDIISKLPEREEIKPMPLKEEQVNQTIIMVII